MRTQNFTKLRDRLLATVPDAPARLADARQRTLREIEGYRQSLRQIRKARDVTQLELAAGLGVSQAQVSRIENQAALYLSTLKTCLAAIGAELELVAVFSDGTRVALTLSDLTERGLQSAEKQQTELALPTGAGEPAPAAT
jgi:transcriptional regulator with XRE-family HTH domain